MPSATIAAVAKRIGDQLANLLSAGDPNANRSSYKSTSTR